MSYSPVGTGKFLIVYVVKICLLLSNVSVLNYAESYYVYR